jgi:nicotinate-nucleotide adenylyltransferase
MHIGLQFGSYNPIHVGHLILADHFAGFKDIDKVWLVVSPQNPHKSSAGLASEHDRLAMVREGIWTNKALEACSVEFDMPKPSYTLDTLTLLRQKHPTYRFSLILGSDNLVTFHKWHQYEEILAHHTIYIYPRPKQNPITNGLDKHSSIQVVDAPLLDISATYIRKRILEGKSIRYLVPSEVETYIASRKLYM